MLWVKLRKKKNQLESAKILENPYFTWGCSDDLALRLKKTLYCSEDDDCYDVSSIALTDVAVSILKESARCSRRKITHRYASSLTRQLSISPCALIMSLLYSERLRQCNPGYLDRISSSDLYVISMLVATKFLHDEGEQEEIYNDEWAEAAGLAVSTVNRLEREFLDAIDWNIYVKPADFLDYCSKIETKIALKYGLQRGWFSYTDLAQFLHAIQYQTVLKDVIEKTVTVICGCALVYGMSLSILVSTALTYASQTSHRIQTITQTSTNHTRVNDFTPLSMLPSSSIFASFSDRRLTRRRGFRSHRKTTDMNANQPEANLEEISDLALERLQENVTASRPTLPCTADSQTHALRFESQLQHRARQTRLSITFDLTDRRFMAFDEVGYHEEFSKNVAKCYGYAATNVKKKIDPIGSILRRNAKKFMYDPRILGMTVI
eukprot:TCONS_00002823-protein